MLKVENFSFGSPASASSVSKPIFEIKSTVENNNIYMPMLSGSGKNFLSFGSLTARASPKSSGGGFYAYYVTSRSGGFKFRSSTGGVNLRHYHKSRQRMLVVQ